MTLLPYMTIFFFSSRRRHTRWPRDWSSDVCSSDLTAARGRHSFRFLGPRPNDRLSHPVKEAAYRAAIHLNPQRGVERLAHFLQAALRSEEHTSELQSRGHLVCRLLLEKKKTTIIK